MDCPKCWDRHCTCDNSTQQTSDESYKNEYKRLRSICLNIHYARIAMREDLVIKGLEDIDAYFREPNMN
jgi:hypothetical protein